MTTAAHRRPATNRPMGGFTLVELLVVISIIAILIGLLIPVLAGVRTGARSARTQTQMQSILTACGQFKAQNQRNPGVFSQDDMGNAQNEDRGFTNMENALLELAGGLVTDPNANPAQFLEVGPFTGPGNVLVDLGRIGDEDGPGFLTLSDSDVANSAAPNITNARSQQVGAAANIAVPDIIDAFGYPILMWTRNEFAGSSSPFAAVESETGAGATRAQYYLNSNAGFLDSRTMGKRFDTDNFRKSTLSSFNNTDMQRVNSLAAIIGDPASPAPGTSPPVPARARGEIVLHSAGVDGLFAANDDGRFEQVFYVPTSNFTGGVEPDETDQLLERLDDIVIGGGG